MATNQVIKTTNTIITEVDQNSFKKAMAQIKKLNKEAAGPGVGVKQSRRRVGGSPQWLAAQRRAERAKRERQEAAGSTRAPRQRKQQERQEKQEQRRQQREMVRRQRMVDKMQARASRFTPQFQQAAGSASVYQKAQFRADFAKINKDFAKGAIGTQTYTARMGELAKQMKAVERQGRATSKALAMNSGSIGGGMSPIMQGMMTAGAGYGILAGGRSLMKTGVDFQSIHSTILMTQKTEEEGKQMFDYLQNLASTLGTDLVTTSDAFAKMNLSRPKDLDLNQMQTMFTGFQEYGTALHLDKNKMDLAQFALQQMFGKGKVTAEELNRQMADAMPGAKQAFLTAWQNATGNMNMTQGMFDEDMSNGLITMDKITPHLAKAFGDMARKGGALDFAVKGINARFNRMINEWNKFKNSIFESKLGDAMGESFEVASKALSGMSDMMSGKVGNALAGLVEGFTEIGAGVYNSFVFADMTIEHYLKKWGMDSKQIEEIFNFAGYAAGALIFAGGLLRITKLLSGLIKLVPGIKSLGGALSAAGIANVGAMTTGGVGANNSPAGGKTGSKAAKIAGSAVTAVSRRAGPIGWGIFMQDMIAEPLEKLFPQSLGKDNPLANGLNTLPGSDAVGAAGETFRGWVKQWVSAAPTGQTNPNITYPFKSPQLNLTNGANVPGTTSPVGQNQVTVTLDQKELLIKTEVQVNDGKVAGLVESMLQDQDMRTLNMILGSTAGIAG
ncbi:tape measure protein [Serratia marcescens]|nr:tape measure protein [Serratia marcescens]